MAFFVVLRRMVIIGGALGFLVAGVACGPLGDGDGGATSSDTAMLTIGGGLSFAGTPALSRVSMGLDHPVDLFIYLTPATGKSLRVHLLIPSSVYDGAKTYACGTEVDLDLWTWPYCTVDVEHYTDADDFGLWSTQSLLNRQGQYGALEDCSVTVDVEGTDRSGTVSCAQFRYRGDQTHPDKDVDDLVVSGSWKFRAI